MKIVKLLSMLLLMQLLTGSLLVTSYAADSSFTYKGHNIFGFGQSGEFTDTDLFDDFKGAMPGDILTETITLKNEASCCDFVKIYIRAAVHDDVSNPLSPKVAERETVVSMRDFLSQLSMTVKSGEKKIFEGAPCNLEEMDKNVFIGSLRRNKTATLKVELKVPAELGNEYANRVGEVDWVILVEEYNDPSDPPDPTPPDPTQPDPTPADPTPPDPTPADPTPADPTPPDPNDTDPSNPTSTDPIPDNFDPNDPYWDAPRTGDHSHILFYLLLMAVSMVCIILLIFTKKRKDK